MSQEATQVRAAANRWPFYGVLIAFTLLSIAIQGYYYNVAWWPTDSLFYSIDETWKLLIGAWVGLPRASTFRRFGKLVLGSCLIWILVNFWLIPSLPLAQPAYTWQEIALSVVRCIAHPFLVALCFHFLPPFRSCRLCWDPHLLQPKRPLQFSIRLLLIVMLLVACTYAVGNPIRTYVEFQSALALFLSDALKLLRWTIVSLLLTWFAFRVKGWFWPLFISVGLSFALGLVVPIVFRTLSSHPGWALTLALQPVVSYATLKALIATGLRLVSQQHSTSLPQPGVV